jgi:hypothetical protein
MKPLPPPPPPLQVSPEQQALIDAIEDDLWTRETAVSEYDGRTVMTGRAKPEWQMRGQDPPSVTRAVEAGEVALREDAARDAADADARTPREQAQKKRRFAGYPVERVTQELARRAAQARAAAAKAETEAAQESRAKGQRRTI